MDHFYGNFIIQVIDIFMQEYANNNKQDV